MISAAGHRVLVALLEAERMDDWDNAEILCEGRECWYGIERTSRAVVNELLRLVVLHAESEQGSAERYTLNEEGRAMALDRNYVPQITHHLEGRQ